MKIQESGEMYLETILILSEKSASVHAIDVCDHMGYSKPSVSRALGILKKAGYITVDEYNHIHLTEEGKSLAEKIYERHKYITNCLIMLGIDEKTASDDACRIEHVISDKSFYVIKDLMDKREKGQ